jgi:hypothetical protein
VGAWAQVSMSYWHYYPISFSHYPCFAGVMDSVSP